MVHWYTAVVLHEKSKYWRKKLENNLFSIEACLLTNPFLCPHRFENTIAAQFFGHTHFDELELFYPKEERYRPCSVAYIGPSVTPYYNLNPGYRIYYVDGDHPTSTRVCKILKSGLNFENVLSLNHSIFRL